MKHVAHRVARVAPFLVVLASSLLAQTTVHVVCTRDNTLYQDPAGFTSNGSGTGVFCGLNATGQIRRALVYFDVAANVPAGAKIVSAVLNLTVEQSIFFSPLNTNAHRVLQAWGEGASVAAGGGGGGTLAQTGDATWLYTSFQTTQWTAAGGDFGPASFVFPLPGFGSYTTMPYPGLIADVQDMLDNPAQNFGWLLRNNETASSTARRISSRETLNTGDEPSLDITYLSPGQSGTWGTGCPVGAGTYMLQWSGVPTNGTTIQLLHQNAPSPSVGANFFSLGLDPIGTALLPSCSVYLPLTQQFVAGDAFLTVGGAATTAVLLPAGFPGFLINCQGATLDTTPLGFSLSNAALIVTQ